MANDNLQSIEQLMGSHDSQRSRLAETQKLVEKWEPTGLLEGLEKEIKRLNTTSPETIINHATKILTEKGYTLRDDITALGIKL